MNLLLLLARTITVVSRPRSARDRKPLPRPLTLFEVFWRPIMFRLASLRYDPGPIFCVVRSCIVLTIETRFYCTYVSIVSLLTASAAVFGGFKMKELLTLRLIIMLGGGGCRVDV